jgi:hypothetical protein
MLGVAVIGWIMAFAVPAYYWDFNLVNSLAFGAIMTGGAALSWFLSAATAISHERHRSWTKQRRPHRPR